MNIPPPDDIPLFVDLDGTLIDGDTLKLSLRKLLLNRPWTVAALLPGLLQGRSQFKDAVAARVTLDAAALPWRENVLGYLKRRRQDGTRLILATAADRSIGALVCKHLGLFDGLIASSPGKNLKGADKVAAILEFGGGREFDYAGDSWADIPVFAAARRSVVVSRDAKLIARAKAAGRVEVVFEE